MNKMELDEALKQKMDLSKSEAARTVNLVFDSMANTLARGDRVEIRG